MLTVPTLPPPHLEPVGVAVRDIDAAVFVVVVVVVVRVHRNT